MKRSAKAYSCYPSDPNPDIQFHFIVFATNAPMARRLALQDWPEVPADMSSVVARRFPDADGMAPSGTVWTEAWDAPVEHYKGALDFWSIDGHRRAGGDDES